MHIKLKNSKGDSIEEYRVDISEVVFLDKEVTILI